MWAEVGETTIARIYSLTAGIVVMLVASRLLGPERQGVVVATIAWSMFVAQLFGLSLGQIIHNHCHNHVKNSLEYVKSITFPLILLALLFSFGALVVGVVLYKITSGGLFGGLEKSALIIGFSLVPFIVLEEYLRNLLAIAGFIRGFNVAIVVGRTLWVIITLYALFVLNGGILCVLVAQLIGQLFVVMLASYYLVSKFGISRRFSFTESWSLCREGLKLHANSIGTYVLIHNGVLILNYHVQKEVVAWYQIAFQLVMVLAVLPQSASTVLYSRMANLGVDRLWQDQKYFVIQVVLAMLVVALISYIFIPYVIEFVLGSEYEPVVAIFRFLLPMLIGVSLAQLLAPQWIGRGLFFQTAIITVITAVLSVISNLILIPEVGYLGAVWTAVVGLGLLTIVVQGVFAIWCNKRTSLQAK